MTQLLTSKTAIIYGAGGSIGSAVARTFAAEGATVHLAGRTRQPLEALAAEIGDAAHVAVVDALDERAVDEHADAVAASGGIDISFNLITQGDAQGTPIADMTKDAFLQAIVNGASTLFLTARAAARHMRPQGSGVILHLSSGSSRGTAPGMGNTGPKDAAMDATARYLAAELGPYGIRVCGIHTAAVQDTLDPDKVAKVSPEAAAHIGAMMERLTEMTMLRRRPDLQQIADTAAFLASDRAGALTSQMVNATCGLVAG
jgi:NAD(P)-dependent dehydrogenase (short-subunit alcohol dehydrogenase family)